MLSKTLAFIPMLKSNLSFHFCTIPFPIYLQFMFFLCKYALTILYGKKYWFLLYLNSLEPQVEGGESEDANLSKPQVKDKHVRLKVINDIVIESWGWPTVKQIVIKPFVALRLNVLKDQNVVNSICSDLLLSCTKNTNNLLYL